MNHLDKTALIEVVYIKYPFLPFVQLKFITFDKL